MPVVLNFCFQNKLIAKPRVVNNLLQRGTD